MADIGHYIFLHFFFNGQKQTQRAIKISVHSKAQEYFKMPSAEIAIKNKHCGKYIHPKHQHPSIPDGDPLLLWDGHHSNTYFVFEQVDGIWGYIRHTKSNKVWHPLGGPSMAGKNGTKLCLHSSRGRHALFTLDRESNQIKHIDGLFVHYFLGKTKNPPNGDSIVLHSGIHEGIKWTFAELEFVIKNNHCGKYIHPKHQHPSIPNDDPLLLWDGHHSNTRYAFEPVDGIWGYIRHTKSNKVWHPLGGATIASKNGTKLCLHSDRGRHALFTLDRDNNQIKHIDGLFVHYSLGKTKNPPNGDNLVLHQDQHEGTKWTIVMLT
ncbi:unnamed protein product, partial [Meganyctiphanes norvegica]